MQDRGYVVIAVNEVEYRQAAALAYSIRIKNADASISMVVDDLNAVNDYWLEPFDNAIELPFIKAENARENDWQLYWTTPYWHTIAIDCRTLVKENHDQLWDYLIENHDICFPSKVLNFDSEPLVAEHMSPYVTEYAIKPVYSGMFYFKKDSDKALNYFKLSDPYMRNWRTAFSKHFSPQHVTVKYNPDIMHSLIVECLGEDVHAHRDDIFNYIDMETSLTDGKIGRWKNWTDRLNVWASRNSKIKIQNFAINRTMFYFNEVFLTNEIYNEHRDHYRAAFKSITEIQ
jgi:hypothetical protein